METTNVSTPVDGWNAVTILAHIVALIAEHDRRYQQRFEDHEAHMGRAAESAERLRTEATLRLEQRFEGQVLAVRDALNAVEVMRHELELRHEQRFQGQERAVAVALDSVNKEFHEHLMQYTQETKAAQYVAEKAVAAALTSTTTAIDKQERATEMAITKQEIATEKRFEGVNEFRAQLADQAASFARRGEVEARFTSLTEKLETAVAQLNANVAALDRRTSDSFTALGSRLDLIKGSSQGYAALWGYLAGAIFLVIAIVSFLTRT